MPENNRTVLDAATEITIATLASMKVSPESVSAKGAHAIAEFFGIVLQGVVEACEKNKLSY
jgi:hypothetical protein